ncbi:MAG: hypothetical protein ACREDZ_10250, partial [Kiloniellales bacterium]
MAGSARKSRARSSARAAARTAPVGVIDIGSNSVRLVVYEKPTRAITPLFNEKVLCGLGRGLAKGGELNAKGVELARASLVHFARVSRAMGVEKLHLLATAAVREAGNGPQFVAEVETICRAPVKVLSGGEEARLAALGVVAGLPEASGLCGDLGGGSLADNQTGSIFRASYAPSDFLLVELEEDPDASFNVFFTGWDVSGA